MDREDQEQVGNFISKPVVGTTLAVAAGLSFFFLCMILPLVGPSGSKVAHAAQNQAAFLGVLVATFLLAGAAAYSKMLRRRAEGGPRPYWMLGLCGVCVLTLIVLLLGGLAI